MKKWFSSLVWKNEWPAQSTDHNPIQQLWDDLERQASYREQIPAARFKILVESLPRIVEAVTAAQYSPWLWNNIYVHIQPSNVCVLPHKFSCHGLNSHFTLISPGNWRQLSPGLDPTGKNELEDSTEQSPRTTGRKTDLRNPHISAVRMRRQRHFQTEEGGDRAAAEMWRRTLLRLAKETLKNWITTATDSATVQLSDY